MRHRVLGALALPMILLAQCAPDGCAPPPPPPLFGDGTVLVGTDVPPGIYRATSPAVCHWARIGPGPGGPEVIVQKAIAFRSTHIVEIEATDVAFRSTGCNGWAPDGPRAPVDAIGQGDWAVGSELPPGRWQSAPGTTGCRWERASGFTHEPSEIIASGSSDGPAVVDVAPTDVRFTVNDCGAWTRVSG